MNARYRKEQRSSRRAVVGIALALCLSLPAIQASAQAGGAGQRIDLKYSFDDKAGQERLFVPNSSASIEWVNGIGKGDKAALKVTHIEGKSYTGMENAVRLTFAEPLPSGAEYQIVAWFYVPAAGNEGKETLTGPGIVLNGEYAKSSMKFPSDFGTMPIGEWKEVNVATPMMDAPLQSVDFRFVINDKPKHADLWYIDEISVRQKGAVVPAAVAKWDLSIASLADRYKSRFLIGNIMNSIETSNPGTTTMFKHHYNAVTAENEMKPQYLSPAKGVYGFGSADKIVSWAQANGLAFHGHVLVWHSQSAAWLTKDAKGSPLTRAEASSNLKDYIGNVAGHFKGKITWWEVVNEAFDGGSGIPTDWKAVLRKNSPWYLAYENGADKAKGESGADYIYDAFVLARQADPAAVLYYNDYNETEAWKYTAMALMAEELNRKWKTDARNAQSGRPLVEGIGMQGHYWIGDLNVADVEAAVARFVKAGVKISVTELDIPAGTYNAQRTPPLTKDEELLQARLYAQLFQIFEKYAASIERVTFWAKADSQSWRGNGSPVLFDRTFAAKKSYYAVIDPEGYLKSAQK
jgi:GH35 family endo-1,4-beta-xylanase